MEPSKKGRFDKQKKSSMECVGNRAWLCQGTLVFDFE